MSNLYRVVSESVLLDALNAWSDIYLAALKDHANYAAKHDGFLLDARLMIRQLRAANMDGTMFDYLREIFHDSSKRGYEDTLHYLGLKKAYRDWAYSVTPIPRWAPAGGIPPLPTIPPAPRTGKHKPCQAAQIIIDEMERIAQEQEDMENSEYELEEIEEVKVKKEKMAASKTKEAARGRKAPARQAGSGAQKASAAEDDEEELTNPGRTRGARVRSAATIEDSGAEDEPVVVDVENDPPCKKCVKARIPCLARWEMKGGQRVVLVCAGCFKGKVSCDYGKKGKAKATSPSREVKISAPPVTDPPAPVKPARRIRKKPTKLVEAGAAGEYNGTTSLLLRSSYMGSDLTSSDFGRDFKRPPGHP